MDDPSTTICGGFQKEIQLGQCWNSTFAYYSIDMCDTPNPSSTASASPSPSNKNGPTTGILVGAVLGGLAGGALLVGFALWVLARKKRARKARNARAAAAAESDQNASGPGKGYAEMDTNPYSSEMDGAYQRHEMEQGKVVYKHERAMPVVELDGLEVRDGGGPGR